MIPPHPGCAQRPSAEGALLAEGAETGAGAAAGAAAAAAGAIPQVEQ
jgi:hypothetical protein